MRIRPPPPQCKRSSVLRPQHDLAAAPSCVVSPRAPASAPDAGASSNYSHPHPQQQATAVWRWWGCH
jgi:hypothetical protein